MVTLRIEKGWSVWGYDLMELWFMLVVGFMAFAVVGIFKHNNQPWVKEKFEKEKRERAKSDEEYEDRQKKEKGLVRYYLGSYWFPLLYLSYFIYVMIYSFW